MSIELKIIVQYVSVIGYMSSVTTYFSALNNHFSGVTMDLRSLRTMNSGQGSGFSAFLQPVYALKKNSCCILHGVTNRCGTGE